MPASHERQITLLATFAGVPALVASLVLLWTGPYHARTRWTVAGLLVLLLLLTVVALRRRIIRPLQTLSNMLAAIREQDYSLRARRSSPGDALGLAMFELNALMGELRERRLGALEATALLQRVMGEIDVGVFAFDEHGALRVVNPAGERLLHATAGRLLGRQAAALGLARCLEGDTPRLVELELGGGTGRWELRRGGFRQGGRPHQFILLADVSRSLRQEERLAWQRLIRVLGHEINNSLTPIRSIAGRLRQLGSRNPANADFRDDLDRGLGVITARSEALTRFLASYTRLAHLPPPRRQPVDVAEWVQRVVRLETRLPVTIVPGPPLVIQADGDQLDQLLINLISNAVDAVHAARGGPAGEANGKGEGPGAGGGDGVMVSWSGRGGSLLLTIDDNGLGLPESANLFVPFFTTKPGGTGIGLVLSQQIAEAHHGSLVLVNREPGPGCRARLTLPGDPSLHVHPPGGIPL